MSTNTRSADELFRRYFSALYPAGADLARLRREDHNPGHNPAFAARIAELAEVFVRLAPAALGAADLVLDYSDASVHRMGAALTSERLSTWLREADACGDPLASPPTLVAMATHGALYVGECVRRNHDATWLVRQPLWESLVRLRSARGVGDLPLFHWWLKALADLDAGRPTLFDRYRTHVEVPTVDAGAIPVIADPGRRLPRLHKVRYDTLHQHLRAHLPELKTVGDDFPSAARLDELALTRLDFTLVGEGRVLVVHGASRVGIHLFWLDLGGFRSAAFVPTEGSPIYTLAQEGDMLRLAFASDGGDSSVLEWLWWGP